MGTLLNQAIPAPSREVSLPASRDRVAAVTHADRAARRYFVDLVNLDINLATDRILEGQWGSPAYGVVATTEALRFRGTFAVPFDVTFSLEWTRG